MKCPACNHEAPQAEFGEPLQCPSCGAYYAKALAAKQRLQAEQQSQPLPGADASTPKPSVKPQPSRPGNNGARPVVVVDLQMPFMSMVVFMVKWAIAAIPAMIILVLIGAIFFSVLSGIFVGLGTSSKSTSAPTSYTLPSEQKNLREPAGPSTAVNAEPAPINARLTAKAFREGQYGQNAITFTVLFENSAGKDIRAFDGVMTFTDLLGNEILTSKLAINDPIVSRDSLSWKGELDYNQFTPRHQQLRSHEFDTLLITFDVGKVLFADGTTVGY